MDRWIPSEGGKLKTILISLNIIFVLSSIGLSAERICYEDFQSVTEGNNPLRSCNHYFDNMKVWNGMPDGNLHPDVIDPPGDVTRFLA